jgi:hypothetical protein
MILLILKYYSKYILKNLGLIPSETWNNYAGVHVDFNYFDFYFCSDINLSLPLTRNVSSLYGDCYLIPYCFCM